MSRVWTCAALVASLSLAPARATADARADEVIIVTSGERTPVLRQLRAELASIGITVRVLAVGDPTGVDVTRLVPEHEDVNMVVLDSPGGQARVHRPGTGTTTVALRPDGSLEPARRAALQIAELVRPATAPLPPPPTSEPTANPSPTLQRSTPPSSMPRSAPRVSLAAVPGVRWAPGVSPGMSITADLSVLLRRRVGFGLAVGAPVVSSLTAAPEGSARLWPVTIALGARGLLTDPRRRVALEAGLGAGAAVVTMVGQADAPYEGRRDTVTSFMAEARLGAGLAMTPRLRLRTDLQLGLVAPAVTIRIAREEAARLGFPVLGAGLGLDLWL